MLTRVRGKAGQVGPLIRRLRLTGSLESARRLTEVERLATGRSPVPPTVRDVRLRPLRGRRVGVRQGTKDFYALRDTFLAQYHLPPDGIVPATIWDLGANIGMTMAHFAVLYPDARIAGVELDPENAALCRENILPWSERCELVQAAVWTDDGGVDYEREPGMEQGFHVVEQGDGNAKASSITLNGLLERHSWDRVDFVKMDIEGAEREVLATETDWAAAVRSIKVEVHEPYSVDECLRDLRALGFEARPDDEHWAAAVGVRR
jgi:FkbM family methyltransferase